MVRTPAVVLLLLCAGCVTTFKNRFQVTSAPSGALIDIDGVDVGTTPLEISLQCSREWVGLINSPDGWKYERAIFRVTATPGAGAPQSREVNACGIPEGSVGTLRFNMTSEPAAARPGS